MATRKTAAAAQSAQVQALDPAAMFAQMQAMMQAMQQMQQGIQSDAGKAPAKADKPAKPAKEFLEVEYGGKGLEATLADGRKILIKRMRSGKGLYAEVIGK